MRIKEIRQHRGVLQKELAAKIGIAPNTLSQYESGNREPDIETAKKIAVALDVTMDELVGIEREPADEVSELSKKIDDAAPTVKALIKGALSSEGGIKADFVKIKITCPIDSTEQVIFQPVYRIGNIVIPEKGNNGCEMCHPCDACTICRLRAVTSVLPDFDAEQ